MGGTVDVIQDIMEVRGSEMMMWRYHTKRDISASKQDISLERSPPCCSSSKYLVVGVVPDRE